MRLRLPSLLRVLAKSIVRDLMSWAMSWLTQLSTFGNSLAEGAHLSMRFALNGRVILPGEDNERESDPLIHSLPLAALRLFEPCRAGRHTDYDRSKA